MRISLCLIVFNELEGCKLDVPRLPRDEFEEIYAVDGGSSDGTVEFLLSEGITVHRQPGEGLNDAYVFADSLATGEAVVVFFPKGTIPPEDLRRFRPLLERGVQLVIASRYIRGAVNEEDRHLWRPRKWAVRALALLAALLWRRDGAYRVRDVLHGVKGWNREAFRNMRVLKHGISIDIEMVVRAYKLRLSRAEFPTTESGRTYGSSNFKFWPTGKKLMDYLWHEIRCR